MGDYEHLKTELADRVLWIRLNRPEVLNALNQEMTDELIDALGEAQGNPAVGAVVLTGNGRGFCAGADVGVLSQVSQGDGELRPAAIRNLLRAGAIRLATALWELDKPTVAAVNGPSAGAGVALALSCDVLVAAEDAAFSVVFTHRGLVPDYGLTYLLPRLVGLRVARELCLLGEKVPAPRAAELGLVTELVPPEQLTDAAATYARRLADGPGVALSLTKELLSGSFETDFRGAVDREFTAQTICFTTEDAVEGALSFLQKREPQFRSR